MAWKVPSNNRIEVKPLGRRIDKRLHDGVWDRLINVQIPASEAQPKSLAVRFVSESSQDGRMQRGLVHADVSENPICGLRLRLLSLSADEISFH